MSRAWEFLDLSVVFPRTPFHHSQAWIPSSSTQKPSHGEIAHVEASLKQKPTLLCTPRDTPWRVGRKKSRRVGDSQAQSNILPIAPAHRPPGPPLGSVLPKTFTPAGKAQLPPQSTGAQGCHAHPSTSQVHRNERGRQSQECSLTSPGLDILTESLTTGGLSSALRPSL